MSHIPSKRRRTRCLIAVIAGPALACALAAPAEAISLRIPFKVPPIRLPHPPVTFPTGFDSQLKYGIDDPSVVAILEAAETRAVASVDASAERIAGGDSETRDTLVECAGAGLKKAGHSYDEALEKAADYGLPVPAPGNDQLADGIAGCLDPVLDLPVSDIYAIASKLAQDGSEGADQAATAAPYGAVLARWMIASADTLGTAPSTPLPPPPPPTSHHTEDGGTTPWGLILGALAVIGAVAAAIGVARSRAPSG